jgi:hypothetical protein
MMDGRTVVATARCVVVRRAVRLALTLTLTVAVAAVVRRVVALALRRRPVPVTASLPACAALALPLTAAAAAGEAPLAWPVALVALALALAVRLCAAARHTARRQQRGPELDSHAGFRTSRRGSGDRSRSRPPRSRAACAPPSRGGPSVKDCASQASRRFSTQTNKATTTLPHQSVKRTRTPLARDTRKLRPPTSELFMRAMACSTSRSF